MGNITGTNHADVIGTGSTSPGVLGGPATAGADVVGNGGGVVSGLFSKP